METLKKKMHPSGFLVLLFLVLFSGTSAQSNGSFSANGASVTWTVSGDTVTFQMTGDSSGYLALGLSADTRMGTVGIDDVMACHRDGSESVNIKDTHNPQSQSSRANNLDSVNDLVAINASLSGNTIMCSFSRLITTGDSQDRSLNESVYLFLAMSGSPGAANVGLNRHGPSGSNVGISSSPMVITLEENATVVEPTTPPTDPPVQASGSFSANGASVTWTVNGDNVTFQMTGDSTGYLALGLSADRVMGTVGIDDVMACHRDGSGNVNIKDTYNPMSPRGNSLDSVNDLVAINASLSGSTITCSFSRLITTGDSQDRNLDESVYLFLAMSGSPGAANVGLNQHGSSGSNVGVSSSPVVISQGGAVGSVGCATSGLIRAHGIFMFLAWGAVVQVGYFFAAYMKPAMVTGMWFQIHRILMLSAILPSVIGFILIFVNFRDNAGLITGFGPQNPIGTTHMILGVTVVFLQFLNPMIALCRCKPSHKFRWVFNIIHGMAVGWGVIFLAWINMALGLWQFGKISGTAAAFYLFIVFLIVYSTVDIALFIYQRFIFPQLKKKWDQEEKDHSVAMKSTNSNANGDGKEDEDEKPKKKPSKDSPLRYVMLAVSCGLIIVFGLALIILMAVACLD